jgi:hypothetical protein
VIAETNAEINMYWDGQEFIKADKKLHSNSPTIVENFVGSWRYAKIK